MPVGSGDLFGVTVDRQKTARNMGKIMWLVLSRIRARMGANALAPKREMELSRKSVERRSDAERKKLSHRRLAA
jgi:hypothetical protein